MFSNLHSSITNKTCLFLFVDLVFAEKESFKQEVMAPPKFFNESCASELTSSDMSKYMYMHVQTFVCFKVATFR